MLKYAALAALAVAPMLATAAHAEGYYVYSEIESDWSGNEYDGSELKTRVGYEHDLTEDTSLYVELGPQFLLDNGEDADTRLAVEVGGDGRPSILVPAAGLIRSAHDTHSAHG